MLRSVLADAIQNRLSDPRIEPLTSITRVDVSTDLSVAHVYVSVMAEEARQKLSMRGLRHATGRLRSMVARELTLRQTPQLDFRLDDSVQRSFKTVQQLDRIMEELGERGGVDVEQDAGEPTGGDESRQGGTAGEAYEGQEDT